MKRSHIEGKQRGAANAVDAAETEDIVIVSKKGEKFEGESVAHTHMLHRN